MARTTDDDEPQIVVDIDGVAEVLLPDGSWHTVIADSFDAGPLEFVSATPERPVVSMARVDGQRQSSLWAPPRGIRAVSFVEPSGLKLVCLLETGITFRVRPRTS